MINLLIIRNKNGRWFLKTPLSRKKSLSLLTIDMIILIFFVCEHHNTLTCNCWVRIFTFRKKPPYFRLILAWWMWICEKLSFLYSLRNRGNWMLTGFFCFFIIVRLGWLAPGFFFPVYYHGPVPKMFLNFQCCPITFFFRTCVRNSTRCSWLWRRSSWKVRDHKSRIRSGRNWSICWRTS